jgi:carboxymethylenebutenolidase
VNSRSIDIQATDGKSFKGYLSLPPTGTGPGIILFQEIFGVNKHIRAVADQYALDGYVVLAPDMFWRTEPGVDIGYTEADMKTAMGLAQKMDFDQAVKDMSSAVNTLRALPECTGKVASLGYCMGGFLSYLCAANGDVDAAVSYYPGRIGSRLDLADKIKCPLLIHFAGKDQHIPKETVDAVQAAFTDRKNAVIQVYQEADHGFNCWERKVYDQKTSALAHGLTLSFLSTAL